MKIRGKLIAIIVILLISTLACSLTGSANPLNAVQTLIPDEAQTLVAAQAQTLVASVMPPAATVPAGSGGVTSSDCDNLLYPVVSGATWFYAVSGLLPDTFTRTIPAITADGFTDQDVFASGTTRTGQWTCDSGDLTALDPGSGPADTANVQAGSLDSSFQTTAMDGVTLPAEINSGTAWTQNFTIEGDQDLNGQVIPSKNETSYSCTAVGEESVTVPAGTFTAMRVECLTNITITITMAGMEIPTELNFSSTTWYAPGVGNVKSDSILSDGSHAITELTAYNIP